MRIASNTKGAVLVAGLMLLGACSKFDAEKDYRAVAECYSAYSSLSISSRDPALGFSEEDQAIQRQMHAVGVQRLEPFMGRAMTAAGGRTDFMVIAGQWRIEEPVDVANAPTPQAKMAAYQRILRKASDCNQLMESWGVSLKSGPLKVK